MERVDQPPTGGESSGDASASVPWEDFVESPPLPFPRSPEFSRRYSHRERFEGMNNEGSSMNYSEGSSATRGDPMSCFVASITFSFFVMTMAFGLYSPETLKLGQNTSMLIKPNHLFVESIEVVALDASKGSMLYGFYKDPPLDVKVTWSETHRIVLPASTHKEWIFYLNERSRVNISYSVNSHSLSSSSLILVIAKGDTGLAEWLKDPSYPNITPSWNTIHGNGSIQKDMSDSSTYYIAVGNLNDEYAEVRLDITIQAFLYNTTESYYKCTPAEGECTFQLSEGNAAVLTTPGRLPGFVGGDWHVKLSYAPRWVAYLIGTGGVTLLLVFINYFLNHFRRTERRTEQDTHTDRPGDIGSERSALLSHKDDDIPSLGSSYASLSEDEEHVEHTQTGVVRDRKPVKDDENKKLCAICFDAPKNSFFIPCGHCVACYGCATRIVESSGACPICRRHTKKAGKIYSV